MRPFGQHVRRARTTALAVLVSVALTGLASTAIAEELPTDDWRTDTSDSRPNADLNGPILSSNDRWAGPAVIIMAGLFVAAAVVGMIVRAEMPDMVPPAMSHEEDPAADRH